MFGHSYDACSTLTDSQVSMPFTCIFAVVHACLWILVLYCAVRTGSGRNYMMAVVDCWIGSLTENSLIVAILYRYLILKSDWKRFRFQIALKFISVDRFYTEPKARNQFMFFWRRFFGFRLLGPSKNRKSTHEVSIKCVSVCLYDLKLHRHIHIATESQLR